jgi:hypothetical protein
MIVHRGDEFCASSTKLRSESRLRFRERAGAAISFGTRSRRRTVVIETPVEAPVAIQIDAVAAAVVAAIFAPHAAAAGIGGLIVNITVGINTGNEIKFTVVDKIGQMRIDTVLSRELVHEQEQHFHRGRFTRVMERVVEEFDSFSSTSGLSLILIQ